MKLSSTSCCVASWKETSHKCNGMSIQIQEQVVIVFNKHSSAASHSSRLPEDLETCSSIPSLASSFIVDSDVSPISVAEDPRRAGQGILTSTPSRSVFAKADIYCYAKLIPANVS